jgi:hypothetical protein
VYAALAVVGLIVNRRHLLATLMAPFVDHAKRRGGHPHPAAENAAVAPISGPPPGPEPVSAHPTKERP